MAGKRQGKASAKRVARNEARRGQTRTEILDSAREVVHRDGFNGFTLTAVADDLGLTKPALYYYFPNKEALVLELLLREWLEAAAEVQSAVEATDSGADAVERLIRTFFERYRNRLNMFMLSYKLIPALGIEDHFGTEELERIRPTNEMLYGGTEARLRADQKLKIFPKKRDPRRFAFTAHMAVIGLLNMKAIVESVGDPLIHGDDALLDDICRTFRSAAVEGAAK